MTKILRLCLGLAISMALVAPTLAELAITGAPVMMRSGPTGRAGVVQRIPQSAKIDLETCDRNWCRVVWRGRSGYVPAEAVVVGSPPTALSRDKMPPPLVNAPTDAPRPGWRWTGPYFGVNGGVGSNSW